jgi:hypothetical protein
MLVFISKALANLTYFSSNIFLSGWVEGAREEGERRRGNRWKEKDVILII